MQTYYACQLFYVGCTANADVAAELFGADDALTTYATPNRFGSRAEMAAGFLRAVAPPGESPLVRAGHLARRLPRVAKVFKEHIAAFCEVATMLTDRLGIDRSVGALFEFVAERWDGKGEPGRAKGETSRCRCGSFTSPGTPSSSGCSAVPTTRHRSCVGVRGARSIPTWSRPSRPNRPSFFAIDAESAWDEALASEPRPHIFLQGESIDNALAAMADFSDLASPYLIGHSTGVATGHECGPGCRFDLADIATIGRAALVHDIGRVAVPARIWQQPGPLSPDDWERVRLHPYHTERILHRSPFLAVLGGVAGAHHERCDGSGYHRGTSAAGLSPLARLLAAADAYRAKTEPRSHREPFTPGQAAEMLTNEVHSGRLDAGAVKAVLEAAGQPTPRIERPAGLTARETEVIGLLARGLQTKQIARALGISAKTADNHIQNVYAKIGVSSRAAAALFAMQHGLVP